ncbi:MAG: translation initiation factor [Thermoleophilales bacterium]|nr:translation initiation factor [Thermoleophilales bacterium]
MPEVRLIDEKGEQVGVVPRDEALRYAQERDLDLVEVAAEARPPVCRVLDYSKYKYEQEQKAKSARRHQKQVTVREIKLRPKIAQNDYETKKGHVERFLKHNDKVKVTIMFRGREMTHPERGERLLMRLAEDVQDLGAIEQRPSQDGRNMTMTLGPTRVHVETDGHADADGETAETEAVVVEQPQRKRRGSRRERGALPQQQEHQSQAAAPADAEAPAPAEAEAPPAAEPEAPAAEPEPATPEPEAAAAEPEAAAAEPESPPPAAEPEADPPAAAEPEPQAAAAKDDAGASPTAGGF